MHALHAGQVIGRGEGRHDCFAVVFAFALLLRFGYFDGLLWVPLGHVLEHFCVIQWLFCFNFLHAQFDILRIIFGHAFIGVYVDFAREIEVAVIAVEEFLLLLLDLVLLVHLFDLAHEGQVDLARRGVEVLQAVFLVAFQVVGQRGFVGE